MRLKNTRKQQFMHFNDFSQAWGFDREVVQQPPAGKQSVQAANATPSFYQACKHHLVSELRKYLLIDQ
jgi:hypothetical protein